MEPWRSDPPDGSIITRIFLDKELNGTLNFRSSRRSNHHKRLHGNRKSISDHQDFQQIKDRIIKTFNKSKNPKDCIIKTLNKSKAAQRAQKAVYVRKRRITCAKDNRYTYVKVAQHAQKPYTNVRKSRICTQNPYTNVRKSCKTYENPHTFSQTVCRRFVKIKK